MDLRAGVAVLVGENGSGKSTVAEVIAEACGLNPQGGSAKASYRTRDSEPGIGGYLWAERGLTDPAWSYFLRADTMHGLYSYLEENPGRQLERFHEVSHGEGFLQILRTRVNQPGFYIMDEPDAPLSFVSCLSLVLLVHELGQGGAQVIVATHSPVMAAVPGARIGLIAPRRSSFHSRSNAADEGRGGPASPLRPAPPGWPGRRGRGAGAGPTGRRRRTARRRPGRRTAPAAR